MGNYTIEQKFKTKFEKQLKKVKDANIDFDYESEEYPTATIYEDKGKAFFSYKNDEWDYDGYKEY